MFAPVAVKYTVPPQPVRSAGYASCVTEPSEVTCIVPALVPSLTQTCRPPALPGASKKSFVPTTVGLEINCWFTNDASTCGTVSQVVGIELGQTIARTDAHIKQRAIEVDDLENVVDVGGLLRCRVDVGHRPQLAGGAIRLPELTLHRAVADQVIRDREIEHIADGREIGDGTRVAQARGDVRGDQRRAQSSPAPRVQRSSP